MSLTIKLVVFALTVFADSSFAQSSQTKLYELSTLEQLMGTEIFKSASNELKEIPGSRFRSIIQSDNSYFVRSAEGRITQVNLRCMNSCTNFRLSYEAPQSNEDRSLKECFIQFRAERGTDFVLVEKADGWSEWVETEVFKFSRIGAEPICRPKI